MTKAAARRYAAIRILIDEFIDADNGNQVREGTTVDQVVEDIEALRALGRTARWSSALNRWQGMIKMGDEYQDDLATWKRHMHWALIQGSVYAGFEAE
jgi:hypothetical protein